MFHAKKTNSVVFFKKKKSSIFQKGEGKISPSAFPIG